MLARASIERERERRDREEGVARCRSEKGIHIDRVEKVR